MFGSTLNIRLEMWLYFYMLFPPYWTRDLKSESDWICKVLKGFRKFVFLKWILLKLFQPNWKERTCVL